MVDEVEKAVLDSKITWQEIDYLEAARYVALNCTEAECRSSKLWRILPRRRGTRGTRPGLKGAGPQGGLRGDQEQWEFPMVRLRKCEKRLLVATVVRLVTRAMFKHHYYEFGGGKSQQKEGGPIGLRGTCTVARLIMQCFDGKWGNLVRNAGLLIKLYMRYMDDGRILLQALKRGWRWRLDRLEYCKKWELEDMSRSLLDITVEAIRESMRGVTSYLSYTYETGEDFPEGWLPTLDTMRVGPDNVVQYKYYEKPTTINTTLLKNTAIGENSKIKCLSNDLTRRLLNTREELPSRFRAQVVDQYATQLLTSGYSYEQTRRMILSGARGYMAKVKRMRSQSGRRRIHRTAEESSHLRVRKKLLGKSSWYKDKNKKKEEDRLPADKRTGRRIENHGIGEENLRTRAVLFVEQTPKGELARLVREQLQRMGATLGYKVRVVERTGRSIISCFPQTKTWGDIPCGRTECVTCHQPGEEIPDCIRASLVYESICLKCNPGATAKGELKQPKEGAPSLYVGESSRSFQEHAMEHWGDARRKDKKRHMSKHQELEHVGEPPQFLF